MILRSITLENFGLYSGRQTLDLVPRRGPGAERPVVLIGGKNGAGKTTLLEALRLALYGKRALGFRIAQSEYEDHLRGRVHVGADGITAEEAAVGLEFDYAEGGVVSRYTVRRSWSSKVTRLSETLTLEKDGTAITSVPREEWHHFLQELIPPGVSQLFFFDGEKIAEIAHDGADEGLAEAVRGLLGIELVGRLRTDLGLFLARRGRNEDPGLRTTLENCIRQIDELETNVAQSAEAVAELIARRANLERAAADARQRFVVEGGDAASRRTATEATRDEIKQQISRRQAEIKELSGGLLPFAAAPKLVTRFSQALERAKSTTGVKEAEGLRERMLAWRADARPPREAAWKDAHWRDLEAFLRADELEDRETAGSPVAGLEVGERAALLARLSQVKGDIVARASLLVRDLDSLGNRLRQLEADLVRASGHAAGIVLDELLLAEQHVGAAAAELKARDEELRSLQYQRATLIREKDRILTAQVDSSAAKGRAELATRVSRALQQYEERLLDHKLAQLQAEFVQCFNHIARKGGFVAEVRIDRATFDATLIDKLGREIPKASLSAGEKQIYAIAMLWGLARTSGRALPMIIDTPLARLDSEHRRALVERNFPEASHQVVVLSTDTEIDDQLLEILRPSISHSYCLDYERETSATVVRSGYFDDDEEAAGALQQA
jgi:DNA sulfur modification protein DndD